MAIFNSYVKLPEGTWCPWRRFFGWEVTRIILQPGEFKSALNLRIFASFWRSLWTFVDVWGFKFVERPELRKNCEMKKIASIPELVLGKITGPPYIWGYELQVPVDFLSNQSIQSNAKTWVLNHSDQFLQASAFKCGIQRFSRADGKYFLLPFCLQKHCCRQVVIDGQYLLYNWIVKVWLLTFHRKLWKPVAITAQEKWHRSLRQTTIAFHFPTTMNSRNNLFWDVVMSWDFNSSKSILSLNHRFFFVACVFLQPPG